MKTDTSVGLALGLVLAALSVGLNVLRGDPHLVTSFPNLAMFLVPPLVIYLALLSSREADRKAIVGFGMHMAVAAALTFATVFTLFAWLWLARISVQVMLFGFLTTFTLTLIVGSLATAVCGRFLKRSAGTPPSTM
jgi:hypothetical protein